MLQNPLINLGFTPRAIANLQEQQIVALAGDSASILAQLVHPDRNEGRSSSASSLASRTLTEVRGFNAEVAIGELRKTYRYLDEHEALLARTSVALDRCKTDAGYITDFVSQPLGSKSLFEREALLEIAIIGVWDTDLIYNKTKNPARKPAVEKKTEPVGTLPQDLLQDAREKILGKKLDRRLGESGISKNLDEVALKELLGKIGEAVASNQMEKIPSAIASVLLAGIDLPAYEQRAQNDAKERWAEQSSRLKALFPERNVEETDKAELQRDNRKDLRRNKLTDMYASRRSTIYLSRQGGLHFVDPSGEKLGQFVGLYDGYDLEGNILELHDKNKDDINFTTVPTSDPNFLAMTTVTFKNPSSSEVISRVSLDMPSFSETTLLQQYPMVAARNEAGLILLGRCMNARILS